MVFDIAIKYVIYGKVGLSGDGLGDIEELLVQTGLWTAADYAGGWILDGCQVVRSF